MPALVKATITHLATLESFPVLWNPSSYRISRSLRPGVPPLIGSAGDVQSAAGREERFTTRLFLDASEGEGPARDLRAAVERFERWARVEDGGLPPHILFSWGPFRFRGTIEVLEEEWIRFDPDGNPVRGWIDLSLRSRG
jgi:hypothetical protein